MKTSIPRSRPNVELRPVRSHSLRALAVAAHLERGLEPEGPPGHLVSAPSEVSGPDNRAA